MFSIHTRDLLLLFPPDTLAGETAGTSGPRQGPAAEPSYPKLYEKYHHPEYRQVRCPHLQVPMISPTPSRSSLAKDKVQGEDDTHQIQPVESIGYMMCTIVGPLLSVLSRVQVKLSRTTVEGTADIYKIYITMCFDMDRRLKNSTCSNHLVGV